MKNNNNSYLIIISLKISTIMHAFTYPIYILLVLILNKKFKFINTSQYHIYKSLFNKKKTSKGPPIGKVISTHNLQEV